MPDILIRGMEMPQSCAKCPFEVFGDCYGGKVKRIMDIEDYMDRCERHPDCPLHELPPHGDLIDRDDYIAMMESNCDKNTLLDPYILHVCRGGVKTMPVVVPAEREGE